MAMNDLADYDILELMFTRGFSDDEKGKYLAGYMEAFMAFLSDEMGDSMKDADADALQKLLADPTVTPTKLEKFYRDRIPNYDDFLFTATLAFKKRFLIEYYKTMMQKIMDEKQENELALWMLLVDAADEDDWNEVAEVITRIQTNASLDATPTPAASDQAPAVVN
jgi:hypothetical protein